jgi:hypothetical protein
MTGKLLALFALWLFATGAAAPVRMTPVKITDGVYMFQHSQGSGNSTVVITNDGVLVLDFHIDNADQTLAGIRKLTDKKVKYLISSHSAGDLTVYIPQKRVMLTGDLLDTEIHPGQGESAGVFFSNVKGWLQILDNIMARNLPVDTYVPGHGPAHIGRGVKDLEEQKRYFVVMRDEVAKMVAAGKSLEQIEKEFKIPQEFAHYTRPERLKQFYKLFYNQLMETGY